MTAYEHAHAFVRVDIICRGKGRLWGRSADLFASVKARFRIIS